MENTDLQRLLEKKEIIGTDFSGLRLECRAKRVSFKILGNKIRN